MNKATCVFLLNNENHILAVSRRNNHNDFGLPGGSMESYDNTPKDGIVRELYEETGLTVKHSDLTLIDEALHNDTMVYCYMCKIYTGEIKIEENGGAVKWMSFHDFMNPNFSFFDYNYLRIHNNSELKNLLIDEMVKKINSSDLYGTIVESGLGIAQLIYDRPNASKTIAYSICTYSKNSQYMFFDIEPNTRSVSEIYVNKVAEKMKSYRTANTLSVVASFQVGQNCINHGWLNINDNIYHLTVDTDDKKLANNIIAETVITLICNKLLGCKYMNINKSIANIDIFPEGDEDDMFNSNLTDMLFIVNGVKTTFAQYVRSYNKYYIFKGSFNPLHYGHTNMIEDLVKYESLNNNDISSVILSISLNTFGKGNKSYSDIKGIIENINQNGYPVLIYSEPLFVDMSKRLSQTNKVINKSMNYMVGLDTFHRIVKYNEKNTIDSGGYDSIENDNYFIFNRELKGDESANIDYENFKSLYGDKHKFINYRLSNISSTMIRNEKNTL